MTLKPLASARQSLPAMCGEGEDHRINPIQSGNVTPRTAVEPSNLEENTAGDVTVGCVRRLPQAFEADQFYCEVMQDAPVEFESAQATSGNSKPMIADYPVFLAGPYASMSASGRRSLPSKDDDCARSVDGRGSQGPAKQAIACNLELELFESFNNRSPAGCVPHADEHLFSQEDISPCFHVDCPSAIDQWPSSESSKCVLPHDS